MEDKITFDEFQLIPVANITTGTNHRKKFDDKAIKELADSIKKVGLINPITVAETHGDDYILIAGERRLKACIMNGWLDIPSIIADGPLNRLKEIQIIENAQRVDINPIEELNSYMELIKDGYEPSHVAEQVGKPLRYINDRLNLIRLADDAKMLLYGGELNMSQCKYLLLMPEEVQQKALESLTYRDGMRKKKYLPAKSFYEYFVKNNTLPLSTAYFDAEDETLGNNIKCSKCKFNSDANKLLFSDISKAALCSNYDCFMEKTNEHINRLVAKWEEEGLEIVQVTQVYSTKYDFEHNYERIPDDEIEKGIEVLKMLVVLEGNNIGNSYPIYSESQLKVAKSVDKIKSNGTTKNANKAISENKLKKALARYGRVVVSEVSKEYVQKNDIFTISLHLLSMFNTFKTLEFNKGKGYLKMIGCDIKALTSPELNECFLDNIDVIAIDLEKNFAVLNLMKLEGYYAFKGEPENILLSILAKDAGVELECIKIQIADEYGVDLSEI